MIKTCIHRALSLTLLLYIQRIQFSLKYGEGFYNDRTKKVYTLDWAGRPLTIETGQLAKQANGAVLVRYGDTTVLSTATASKTPRGLDFFPLNGEL